MKELLLVIILCLFVIFFIKNLISILIVLCIISFCMYYLMNENMYVYVQNVIIPSNNNDI